MTSIKINSHEDISPKTLCSSADRHVHLCQTYPQIGCSYSSWCHARSSHPCISSTIHDDTCDKSYDYSHRSFQSWSDTMGYSISKRMWYQQQPTLGHSFVLALIQLAVSLSSSHFFTHNLVTPHKAGLWSPLKLQPKQLAWPHLHTTIGISDSRSEPLTWHSMTFPQSGPGQKRKPLLLSSTYVLFARVWYLWKIYSGTTWLITCSLMTVWILWAVSVKEQYECAPDSHPAYILFCGFHPDR